MDNYSLFDEAAKSEAWFSGDVEDEREDGEEYSAFVDKFKTVKTTDDCFTPPLVYDAVADFVSSNYEIDRKRFVRPFYPGGDYTKYSYVPESVVVDNPPFSILASIIAWYAERNIKFFLFAPALTLFSSSSFSSSAIPCGVGITYENGAVVATSFLTNLEDKTIRVKTYPELYKAIQEADRITQKENKRELPKYIYPDNVITAAMVQRWCKYGVRYVCRVEDSLRIGALDAQRPEGKVIFGSGYLLSSSAAAERAAAERAAAERAAAQKWRLSDRELEMVKYLDHQKERKRR
jgi:hypothetical protein